MAGVNKVILLGNLGSDPEVRQVGETKVANFNIATSEKYKKRDGTLVEETEWHRIELWGNQAELAEKYLKKGNTVYIEGKIKTEEYVDKEGATRRTVKIKGESMTFVGGNKDAGQASTVQTEKPQQASTLPTGNSASDQDLPF